MVSVRDRFGQLLFEVLDVTWLVQVGVQKEHEKTFGFSESILCK